jgi:hypothetical protein
MILLAETIGASAYHDSLLPLFVIYKKMGKAVHQTDFESNYQPSKQQS